MALEIEYSCGCKYLHWGVSGLMISHLCDKHKQEIVSDRLKEMLGNDKLLAKK